MKATISEIHPKTWKDKEFYEFTVEGQDVVYSCWQPAFKDKKVGEEIEFTVTADKRGQMTRATLATTTAYGGRPQQPKSNKPFGAAYSKDITVEFIKNGQVKTTKEADALILHYYTLFMGLMGEN